MSCATLGKFVVATILSVSLLTGCAISTRTNSYHSDFEIGLYWTETDRAGPDLAALEFCLSQNRVPALVDYKKGCMLFCGSEYSYYNYRCDSADQKRIDNAHRNATELRDRVGRQQAERNDFWRRLSEAGRAYNESIRQQQPVVCTSRVNAIGNIVTVCQ